MMFEYIQKVWQTIPVAGIFAFLISFCGLNSALASTNKISDALSIFGVDVKAVQEVWKWIMLPWSIMQILNILGLILCVLASGVIREKLFGRSHDYQSVKACAGCCLQSVVMKATVITTWLMLIVCLLLSNVTLIIFILLVVGYNACEVSEQLLRQLQEIVWKVQHGDSPGQFGDAAKFCEAAAGFQGAATHLWLGSLVPVVGQAAMLAALSRQDERIANERRDAEDNRELRVPADSVQLASFADRS
mmetsp:Transcript_13542/g.26686  ORF Transcript_13542/g.26686 Transcript_13542/m.26686 type:complete len:247 (-) Transcript_13542:36-776(-)